MRHFLCVKKRRAVSKFDSIALKCRWQSYCLFKVLRPAQEFVTYGDITITGEGLQDLGLCSALRAFEQGGIFIVPHLL
jgi:hypothetical protein